MVADEEIPRNRLLHHFQGGVYLGLMAVFTWIFWGMFSGICYRHFESSVYITIN